MCKRRIIAREMLISLVGCANWGPIISSAPSFHHVIVTTGGVVKTTNITLWVHRWHATVAAPPLLMGPAHEPDRTLMVALMSIPCHGCTANGGVARARHHF
jgi:hypothetical protein